MVFINLGARLVSEKEELKQWYTASGADVIFEFRNVLAKQRNWSWKLRFSLSSSLCGSFITVANPASVFATYSTKYLATVTNPVHRHSIPSNQEVSILLYVYFATASLVK